MVSVFVIVRVESLRFSCASVERLASGSETRERQMEEK